MFYLTRDGLHVFASTKSICIHYSSQYFGNIPQILRTNLILLFSFHRKQIYFHAHPSTSNSITIYHTTQWNNFLLLPQILEIRAFCSKMIFNCFADAWKENEISNCVQDIWKQFCFKIMFMKLSLVVKFLIRRPDFVDYTRIAESSLQVSYLLQRSTNQTAMIQCYQYQEVIIQQDLRLQTTDTLVM
jgi:hypothetical protein